MTENNRFTGKFVIVVVLGGAALTAAFVHDKRATSADIDVLRAEVARLSRAKPPPPQLVVREIPGQRLVAERPAAARLVDAEAVPPPKEELTPEELEHQDKTVNDARVETYERAHASEKLDPEWTDHAVRAVHTAYSGEEFRTARISVDCRATMCRVDFTSTASEADDTAVRQLTTKHPWPGSKFTYFDRETKKGVSYIAREEFELPAFDMGSVKL
jgi:hypothetical protein